MSKPRDPLDITKEAIEKALTSNKYTSTSHTPPLPQPHKEIETKSTKDKPHKKTPN